MKPPCARCRIDY